MLNSHEELRVVVIRTWHDRGAFRARMILQCEPARVIVTDSIDGLCDQLRAFLELTGAGLTDAGDETGTGHDGHS